MTAQTAQTQKAKKVCFVISPIGDEQSEIRKKSDQVLRHLIQPAALKYGYQTVRADQIDRTGMITSQIIEHIIGSDLIVADLSGQNPNVLYELALRHAIRRPFIQIMRAGEKIPFDIASNRTVHFDLTDPDNVVAARDKVIAQIDEIEKGQAEYDNPITQTLDILNFRRSDKPEEHLLGKLVEQISRTNSVMTALVSRMDRLEDISLQRRNAFYFPSIASPGLVNEALVSFPVSSGGSVLTYVDPNKPIDWSVAEPKPATPPKPEKAK